MTRQNLTWREISRYSCQHVGLYFYGISLRLKDSGFHNLVLGNFSLPLRTQSEWSPGACFSKVPKLFGRISGAIILFVSSNEGISRHETLQLIWFLFPLQRMKRPPLQNKQVVVLRMAFRARKVFGTLEKRAPGLCCFAVDIHWLQWSLRVFQELMNKTNLKRLFLNTWRPTKMIKFKLTYTINVIRGANWS